MTSVEKDGAETKERRWAGSTENNGRYYTETRLQADGFNTGKIKT